MIDDGTDDLPVVGGAAAGLSTWIVGYGLTYLLVAPSLRDSPLQQLIEAFEGEPAIYEQVGWVFYNAHFVNTVFRDLPLIGTRTTSFIGSEGGFAPLLYALPAGLLVVAGIALPRWTGTTHPTRGATVGVLVLPGYLLASLAGLFLVEVSTVAGTAGPDRLAGPFLAGIVYPLLFGGAGGALGAYLNQQGQGGNHH